MSYLYLLSFYIPSSYITFLICLGALGIYLIFLLSLYYEACAKVCKFMKSQVETIRQSLDGKNVDAVLTELGTRFHRVIYEHLQQFQYNSTGEPQVGRRYRRLSSRNRLRLKRVETR